MMGIYKITNLISGKCYIGKSVNIEKRWKNHKIAAFNPNSTSYNYPLYRAIRKYGLDNFLFEVIEECELELLLKRESHWIKFFQSYEFGYNQVRGGEDGGGGRKLTEAQVIEIQDKLLTQNFTLVLLAEQYGVHKDTIRDINNGDTWSYLKPNAVYPLYISHKSPLKEKRNTYCKSCGKIVSPDSQYCLDCYKPVTKGCYPSSKEELISDIQKLGFCGAGRKYGVSDNAVRKYCKKLGLSTYISDYKNNT